MTERIQALLDEVCAKNKLQQKFLRASTSILNDDEVRDLDAYLGYCHDRGLGAADVADAYLVLVMDTLKEQLYFARHRTYRHTTFDAVASAVYFNEAYMTQYMVGLAVSLFLWPNHLALKRFYRATLPADADGTYLEIGPGHGFFMMTAMRQCRYRSYRGVDISPTSVALTRSILSSGRFGALPDYALEQRDFLAWDTGDRFDAIVMGEVLEHVERPGAFLDKIAALATPTTHIFITTCFNAPAIDHIYLYRSMDELTAQIAEAGLEVERHTLVPTSGKTLDECIARALPVNIAAVLAKRPAG